MDIPPNFSLFALESLISLLHLSRRAFNALDDLAKSGYDTVGKFLTLDEESLKVIKNLGKKSIKEILTIQERLRHITIKEDHIDSINIPDCRFIYSRETIYPTDYIGVLDISIEAHNVLYNAGIFSAGKLFDMEKEAVLNLRNTNKKISKELLTFITKEKPLVGKISGDEELSDCIQKMTQEQEDYRMSILKESYKNIPQNRLEKSLYPFLYGNNIGNIQNPIAHLSPILKKLRRISEMRNIFSIVVKTSRTSDLVHIQEFLAINLIEFLNKILEPFFSNPQYANSLEILYQRANGVTLQDIAEKRNLTRERIRQIELKSAEKLVDIIKAFEINIVSFICLLRYSQLSLKDAG